MRCITRFGAAVSHAGRALALVLAVTQGCADDDAPGNELDSPPGTSDSVAVDPVGTADANASGGTDAGAEASIALDAGATDAIDGAPSSDGGTSDVATADARAADAPVPDAAPPPDQGLEPDQGIDAGPQNSIGAPCNRGGPAGQCPSGSENCLVLLADGRGLCSRACVPDDPTTPALNEDDCPPGTLCADLGGSGSWCFKSCKPRLGQRTCPADYVACMPSSTSFLPTRRQPICMLPGCESNRDCPVLGKRRCATDTQCKTLLRRNDAFCYETLCALPGNCTPSGLCGPHALGTETAKVGDPCESNFDCPGNGWCQREQRDEQGRIVNRNGYCIVRNCVFADSMPEFECSAGSTCFTVATEGWCLEICDPEDPLTCRGLDDDQRGDYECYDMSLVRSAGGLRGAAWPVCAAALGCTVVGAAGCRGFVPDTRNPLNMQCVDPGTLEPFASVSDPRGICLDNTASDGTTSKD